MADARAAFLDRDGTIIADPGYLADPALLEFIDGSIEALRVLRDAGYKLVVVTNQSGIARGLYTIDDYYAVEKHLEQLLRVEGIELDAVHFCPHHPDFTGPCDCRKPGLGMYKAAARNLGLDLATSVYVGDRLKDVTPAVAFGGRGFLVLTGDGRTEAAQVPAGVDVVANLAAAAYKIVGKNPHHD